MFRVGVERPAKQALILRVSADAPGLGIPGGLHGCQERGKTGLILMIWVVFDRGRSVGDMHAEEEDDPLHQGMTNLCDDTIEGKLVLVRVLTA